MSKVRGVMANVTVMFDEFGYRADKPLFLEGEHLRKQRRRRINRGRCMIWAYRVYSRLPQAKIWLSDIGGHVFIKYRGRFYDSETDIGVTCWMRLPVFADFGFRGSSCDAKEVTPERLVDITEDWNRDIFEEVYGKPRFIAQARECSKIDERAPARVLNMAQV